MLLGQGLLRGCGTPAQQADIMCLMLPNTDELLLEQSIFKYLSACYPQPCSNYSNSVLGSPSSKPMQLRLGLGGLRGLMAPGLCPGMHCRSPRSHPTFPAPAAPSWAAGYHLQALARGLCKHLSDSSGSVPTVPAVRPGSPPQHLGNRESPGRGHTAHPLGLSQGRTPNKGIRHSPAKQISSGTRGFWQELEQPWHLGRACVCQSLSPGGVLAGG